MGSYVYVDGLVSDRSSGSSLLVTNKKAEHVGGDAGRGLEVLF